MLPLIILFPLIRSNSEWDLTETRVEETQTEAVVGNETRTYSKVTFYLTLSRKTHYYGINLILPLVVLSLLSTLVFILPAEGGEKASFSIFLMLAFFVLNSIILTSFPMSAETTVIGKCSLYIKDNRNISGITLFKIFIWGGISSDIWWEI